MTQVVGTGLTSSASGNPDRPYDAVDLSSRAFWSSDMYEREKSFAVLRGETRSPGTSRSRTSSSTTRRTTGSGP